MAFNQTAKVLHILLIEDSSADEHLIREAIHESFVEAEVAVACDGEKALEVLNSPGLVADLIILDLTLPKLDGLGVLERHPRYRNGVPVIVFTSSVDPKERLRASKLGISEYLTKPAGLEEFLATISAAIERWAPLDLHR